MTIDPQVLFSTIEAAIDENGCYSTLSQHQADLARSHGYRVQTDWMTTKRGPAGERHLDQGYDKFLVLPPEVISEELAGDIIIVCVMESVRDGRLTREEADKLLGNHYNR